MKKLSEITPAWEIGDDISTNTEWEKDKLLIRLKEEEHTAIAVGRAVIIIEQCEPTDDFPGGGS